MHRRSQGDEVSRASSVFSDFEVREACDGLPAFAIIAPRPKDVESVQDLPTVFGISGEEQMHVSKFIRSWKVEEKGWQVVVPLRAAMGTPYFFDPGGLEIILDFMRRLLEDKDRILLPFGIEGQKLHVFGSSNGGATALAAAVLMPERVASLTLVTGFVPDIVQDLTPLAAVPSIRLYVGDKDELGHCECLQELKVGIESAGGSAELLVIPGAGHTTIGRRIGPAFFWAGLEAARPKAPAVVRSGDGTPNVCCCCSWRSA